MPVVQGATATAHGLAGEGAGDAVLASPGAALLQQLRTFATIREPVPCPPLPSRVSGPRAAGPRERPSGLTGTAVPGAWAESRERRAVLEAGRFRPCGRVGQALEGWKARLSSRARAASLRFRRVGRDVADWGLEAPARSRSGPPHGSRLPKGAGPGRMRLLRPWGQARSSGGAGLSDIRPFRPRPKSAK